MLRISPTPTSAIQKSMNLFDEFGGGNCSENKARTSASTKGSTRADYPSSNYVSQTVSNFVNNFVKNVNNYLTPDTKRAFDQLRQGFTKVLILQQLNLKQYIWVETDASGHVTGGVWVNWLMTWANSIRWSISRVKSFLPKFDTKFTTVSLWPSLRPLKHGGII